MVLDYLPRLFYPSGEEEKYDLGLAEEYVDEPLYVNQINPDKDVKKFYHDHSDLTGDGQVLDKEKLQVLESSAQFIVPCLDEMESLPAGKRNIPVYMESKHRKAESTEGIAALYRFDLGTLNRELVNNKHHTKPDKRNEIGLQRLYKRKNIPKEIEEAYQNAIE